VFYGKRSFAQAELDLELLSGCAGGPSHRHNLGEITNLYFTEDVPELYQLRYNFGEITGNILTPHPTPYTVHPTPYTSHPKPYTLHPAPLTQNPTPYTSHPKPYTTHSTPYTLHP